MIGESRVVMHQNGTLQCRPNLTHRLMGTHMFFSQVNAEPSNPQQQAVKSSTSEEIPTRAKNRIAAMLATVVVAFSLQSCTNQDTCAQIKVHLATKFSGMLATSQGSGQLKVGIVQYNDDTTEVSFGTYPSDYMDAIRQVEGALMCAFEDKGVVLVGSQYENEVDQRYDDMYIGKTRTIYTGGGFYYSFDSRSGEVFEVRNFD